MIINQTGDINQYKCQFWKEMRRYGQFWGGKPKKGNTYLDSSSFQSVC